MHACCNLQPSPAPFQRIGCTPPKAGRITIQTETCHSTVVTRSHAHTHPHPPFLSPQTRLLKSLRKNNIQEPLTPPTLSKGQGKAKPSQIINRRASPLGAKAAELAAVPTVRFTLFIPPPYPLPHASTVTVDLWLLKLHSTLPYPTLPYLTSSSPSP
jgi:hypothetical protein